jgi:hypothetical protein
VPKLLPHTHPFVAAPAAVVKMRAIQSYNGEVSFEKGATVFVVGDPDAEGFYQVRSLSSEQASARALSRVLSLALSLSLSLSLCLSLSLSVSLALSLSRSVSLALSLALAPSSTVGQVVCAFFFRSGACQGVASGKAGKVPKSHLREITEELLRGASSSVFNHATSVLRVSCRNPILCDLNPVLTRRTEEREAKQREAELARQREEDRLKKEMEEESRKIDEQLSAGGSSAVRCPRVCRGFWVTWV